MISAVPSVSSVHVELDGRLPSTAGRTDETTKSRSSPPFLLLRDINCKILTQYDCKEVCTPSQSQVNVGASTTLGSQDDVSQQQGDDPLTT